MLEEYAAWVQGRGYSHQQANHILNCMLCTGYDIKNYKGLYQGCISIQRRCKVTDDIDRMVMALLKYFGDENQIERLDQTISSMVINKWFNNVKFMPLSQRILGGNPLKIYPHSEKKNTGLILDVPNIPYHFNFDQMPYADKGFLFNEEVDLV